MLRRFMPNLMARATPVLFNPRVLPQGFDFFENKVKDLDTGAASETLTTMSLTLTRQDEVIIRSEQVKALSLCSTSGELGVYPGHEYKIAKLVPGVISVEVTEGKFVKYFTSGGFAHINNIGHVDINTVECIPLEDFDLALAEKELLGTQEVAKTGKTEAEKSVAEAQATVYEALIAALKSGTSAAH